MKEVVTLKHINSEYEEVTLLAYSRLPDAEILEQDIRDHISGTLEIPDRAFIRPPSEVAELLIEGFLQNGTSFRSLTFGDCYSLGSIDVKEV